MASGREARPRSWCRHGQPTREAIRFPVERCGTSRPDPPRLVGGCAGQAQSSAGGTCTRAPEVPS
eukprot:2376858-Alexandrium_andersonii.AAC.1